MPMTTTPPKILSARERPRGADTSWRSACSSSWRTVTVMIVIDLPVSFVMSHCFVMRNRCPLGASKSAVLANEEALHLHTAGGLFFFQSVGAAA